ncbi:hypothetical protein A3Q56_02575 [Intoshia linei]|uniref:Replication protein A subunit n=1 Tax=Intoshia linei TaxID=1819745 RepID=A0A177B8D1_9BILA|nr:hypothetical protein A3Q56_02575 [Intoshia linei]
MLNENFFSKLSKGSIECLTGGERIEMPVVQVIYRKSIVSKKNGSLRLRLIISDGIYKCDYCQIMNTNYPKLSENSVREYAVIRLNDYNLKTFKNIFIIYINLFTILNENTTINTILGCPQQLNIVTTNITNSPAKKMKMNLKSSNYEIKENGDSLDIIKNGSTKFFKIVAITPYQNRWRIHGRISSKSDIKHFENTKGTGQLFSFEIFDISGPIRCTCFGTLVDNYFSKIHVNQVYYISKANVKLANKKYSSTNNNYELFFTKNTIITPSFESDNVPKIPFNFIGYNLLIDCKQEYVDVIGVIHKVDDIVIVNSKNGKNLSKRNVVIVDKSNLLITCTLWDEMAINLEYDDHPVIIIKSAKMGYYNGLQLTVSGNSQLFINFDIEEAHILKGWYNIEANSNDFQELTKDYIETEKKIETIFDLNKMKSEKMEYFDIIGTIMTIKRDSPYYKSCLSENCYKKLIFTNDIYNCEKCQKSFKNFNYSYLLNACIFDYTGNVWTKCFDNIGNKIMTITANELDEKFSNDEENSEYFDTFDEAECTQYRFTLKNNIRYYNDEIKRNVTIVSANKIDYKELHLIYLKMLN